MKIEEHGADQARRDLQELGVRAQDVRGVSSKVQAIYRRAEEQRFGYQGPGWPSLAEATRQRKARQRLNPRILRASDVLFRSLTSPHAASQIDRRAPDEFEFGTDVPYARFHQEGRGVPRRTLIDLSPAQRRQIDEAISAFIAKGETR